jgi:hypothetical protein
MARSNASGEPSKAVPAAPPVTAPAAPGRLGGRQRPATAARAARAATADPPREAVVPPLTVRVAVRLMYAGAGLSLVNLIITLATVGQARSLVRNAHPHWSADRISAAVHADVVFLVVTSIITVGLWLVMARTNLAGRGWARIVATVLCALSTLSFASFIAQSSPVVSKLVLVPMWLVGVGAIFLLWRHETSAYIREGKEL